ncbi:hypothetical protein BT93_L1894 [Corymbia citriodora subsp. variegata]|uniref:Bet v I/Major latex protein domain-containing protein n=1 Tax=Corymbia citriodora subsp. variegata TaxID=360336 RepID=A0A8T0CLF9_CORYI|nr:hypothetical protein BT93_L1894 [Corymbia citriodora subsp. variegata]
MQNMGMAQWEQVENSFSGQPMQTKLLSSSSGQRTQTKPLSSSSGQLTQTKCYSSSAKDLFEVYRSQPYRFPALVPADIQKVELLKGKWDKEGSQRRWTFVDDDCGTWEDKVEVINDQGMSITWTLLKGKVPQKLYSSLKVVQQFFARDNGCNATVTLVYKKTDPKGPKPDDYMDLLIRMLQAADEDLNCEQE